MHDKLGALYAEHALCEDRYLTAYSKGASWKHFVLLVVKANFYICIHMQTSNNSIV